MRTHIQPTSFDIPVILTWEQKDVVPTQDRPLSPQEVVMLTGTHLSAGDDQ